MKEETPSNNETEIMKSEESKANDTINLLWSGFNIMITIKLVIPTASVKIFKHYHIRTAK